MKRLELLSFHPINPLPGTVVTIGNPLDNKMGTFIY